MRTSQRQGRIWIAWVRAYKEALDQKRGVELLPILWDGVQGRLI
jgi:hypothetical protein